jgi:hypothetical protein
MDPSGPMPDVDARPTRKAEKGKGPPKQNSYTPVVRVWVRGQKSNTIFFKMVFSNSPYRGTPKKTRGTKLGKKNGIGLLSICFVKKLDNDFL